MAKKNTQDMMKDLNRLTSIEKNLERNRQEINMDWNLRQEENDIVKRIQSKKLENEFQKLDEKGVRIEMKFAEEKQKRFFQRLKDFFKL
jgi:hypothetical protein